MATRRRGLKVADFNTLDDLVQHAADDLGATHAVIAGPETRIYFSRGGQYPYEEARVRRASGYWHADGPHARRGVSRLPREAQPIGRSRSRRAAAAEARRPTVRASRRTGTTVKEMISMTYGGMPDYSDFKRDIRRTNPEHDRPYWPRGSDFPMELVDGDEIELAENYGSLIEFETTRPGYAYGFRGDESTIYSFLLFLKNEFEEGNDAAGNLASSIMYVLGYEWI